MSDPIIATNLDTPLMLAARNGDTEQLEALIASGVNVDDIDQNGRTAFIHASISGEFETAKLLLKAGANINARDSEGRTATHYTVLGRSSVRSRRFLKHLLVKNKADFTIRDAFSFTPLMLCAKSGYFKLIREGRPDLAEILINADVNVNVWNAKGWNALMIGAADGNLKVCELLINAGTDVNLINSEGTSALMIGAAKGNFDLCEKLVKAGADVNLINSAGSNALMLAAKASSFEVCDLLITAGAGPKHPNDPDWDNTVNAAKEDFKPHLHAMLTKKCLLNVAADTLKDSKSLSNDNLDNKHQRYRL